jgi:hypothetical protein
MFRIRTIIAAGVGALGALGALGTAAVRARYQRNGSCRTLGPGDPRPMATPNGQICTQAVARPPALTAIHTRRGSDACSTGQTFACRGTRLGRALPRRQRRKNTLTCGSSRSGNGRTREHGEPRGTRLPGIPRGGRSPLAGPGSQGRDGGRTRHRGGRPVRVLLQHVMACPGLDGPAGEVSPLIRRQGPNPADQLGYLDPGSGNRLDGEAGADAPGLHLARA